MCDTAKLLTGRDYPHLCSVCQAIVTQCVELVQEGPDTEDPEAPLLLAGDRGLLCGGNTCGDKQEPTHTCALCLYETDPEDGFTAYYPEFEAHICQECEKHLVLRVRCACGDFPSATRREGQRLFYSCDSCGEPGGHRDVPTCAHTLQNA